MIWGFAMCEKSQIPFNRVYFAGPELAYIGQAVLTMKVSGDGPFTKQCHAWIEKALGVHKVLLTTSCTHALEMAALLLDVKDGDEVIVPSFTFVSTANAFALRGAKLVFADIRPDTMNMDEKLLPGLITERTKVIVPVHYAGIGCEMTAIMQLARQHGCAVVEDNAHGFFGKYKGQPLGTFGELATLSFHETKNIACGEGGAILVNDQTLAERAEIIREKGTNRARFFRGQVDKYTWVDLGSSWLPSDLLAAFLWAQLEHATLIQEARKRIWMRYDAELQSWAKANAAATPHIPPECDPAWHLYYLILPDLEQQQRFLTHLKERGVNAVFHYQPLHNTPVGQRMGGNASRCPVTESMAGRLVRLPFYNDMTHDEQSQVIEAVRGFSC
jgi:dTDP-4-amino-4,6-dideoxygalactose transaminase